MHLQAQRTDEETLLDRSFDNFEDCKSHVTNTSEFGLINLGT